MLYDISKHDSLTRVMQHVSIAHNVLVNLLCDVLIALYR